jgi:hypothetical protein
VFLLSSPVAGGGFVSIESSSGEGEVVFMESGEQERAEVEGPDAVVDFL